MEEGDEMSERKKVGEIAGSKSSISQAIVEVRGHANLSVNEFVVVKHKGMDDWVLCQVSDMYYKERKGDSKLYATIDILEAIPNPLKPEMIVRRAEAEKVAETLHIEINEDFLHIGNLMGHEIGVYIDPNDLLLTHIAVLGMTGSGKTYTVGVIIEEMIRLGITSIIIDPHGDYGYMKEFYPESIEYVKYEAVDWPRLDNLYNPGKVTIVDVLPLNDEGRCDMVEEIAELFFNAAKDGKIDPVNMVIDECHIFAPERYKTNSKKIIERISAEGRKFGLGLCAVTQRPAKLSKNVLSQCNAQIILRVMNVRDVQAITTSIEGVRKEDKKRLQSLDNGQALVIGSNIKTPQYVQIREKKCGEKKKREIYVRKDAE
jgi:DNA helicase HerA-like ATPase